MIYMHVILLKPAKVNSNIKRTNNVNDFMALYM